MVMPVKNKSRINIMIFMGLEKRDMDVLVNFLKSGLSTRDLDRILGYSGTRTRGWNSWNILQKYNLKDTDKGKLFVYSGKQSKEIIRDMIKETKPNLDLLIKENPPNKLLKYKDTYALAKSEESLYNIFSGETRNIIQNFFNPIKKITKECQFNGCKTKEPLDTVHYLKDRPTIFKECSKELRNKFDSNLFKYDIYRVMKCFLESHSKKKSICFLCKDHHKEFHKMEDNGKTRDLNNFKKKIIFD